MDRARLVLVSLFAFLFAVYVPKARADQWNQATKISINHAMEIPGRVLDPGTYWFTVMRDNPQRNVVQVWNADRQHLLATILTVPDYRVEPTGKTVIKFSERPSNQPQALRAWFYPGDNYGHAFVYPQHEAAKLAKRTGQPVLSVRDDVASNSSKPAKSANEPSVMAMRNARVQAINPSGQTVDKSQAIQIAPNSTTASRH